MIVKDLKAVLEHLPDDLPIGFMEETKRRWHMVPIYRLHVVNLCGAMHLAVVNQALKGYPEITSSNIAEYAPKISEAHALLVAKCEEERKAREAKKGTSLDGH